MSRVWRFTGNPENWLTAIGAERWALNEKNKSLWENHIQEGDTVLFHSTLNTEYKTKTVSSIIGFAYVGSPKYRKTENDHWWIQETRDMMNHWPYVVPLKEIYLFTNRQDIDFKTLIQKKSEEQVVHDIDALLENAIPISELNERATEINPDAPKFPVQGSASGVDEIYEKLILQGNRDWFSPSPAQSTDTLEKRLSETIDEKLSGMSKESLLAEAKSFDNAEMQSHEIRWGQKKVRKENQVQKRRVASLEGYSCQLCGFKYEYTKTNGKSGWIIEVDHIIDKAEGGNENLENLWVLCPNCHSKKTAGSIVIDPEKKKVFEKGEEVQLHHDAHLDW